MKTPLPFYFFIPLLGLATACNPPRPCCDEIISEEYVHRYGVPLPPEEWSERGQHGQVVSTQKDGVVVTRSYESGILHGECTFSFPHRDRIQRKEVYSHGTLTQVVYYYASGVPQQQITYESPERSAVLFWYESGAPQSRENYENGALTVGDYYDLANHVESRVEQGNGLRTQRDGLGILQSVDTIQGGQMVLRTTYHPNGAPATVTPYINSVIEGQRRTYEAGGEPSTIEAWKNNKQHGMTVEFENGEKLSEVPYVNDRREGIERRFRDGQTVAQEITWERGRKQGPCYTYVGNTTQTDWYFGDRLVNKATYDVMRNQ